MLIAGSKHVPEQVSPLVGSPLSMSGLQLLPESHILSSQVLFVMLPSLLLFDPPGLFLLNSTLLTRLTYLLLCCSPVLLKYHTLLLHCPSFLLLILPLRLELYPPCFLLRLSHLLLGQLLRSQPLCLIFTGLITLVRKFVIFLIIIPQHIIVIILFIHHPRTLMRIVL